MDRVSEELPRSAFTACGGQMDGQGSKGSKGVDAWEYILILPEEKSPGRASAKDRRCEATGPEYSGPVGPIQDNLET